MCVYYIICTGLLTTRSDTQANQAGLTEDFDAESELNESSQEMRLFKSLGGLSMKNWHRQKDGHTD